MVGSGSKRSLPGGTPGNPANICLEHVRSTWLYADPPANNKFLLLEDTDTGDILIPLIYMKSILVANYSRKLASLKHREVRVPAGNPLAKRQGLLFWHWAFESPHPIKVLIRRELGESTPQGHLRLVLLPIVYNAMACKPELRAHPLFPPLYRAMRQSSYWPLLLDPGAHILRDLDTKIMSAGRPGKVFDGPRLVESTAMKYMFMFRSVEEMETSKRLRTTTNLSDSQVMSAPNVQDEASPEAAVEPEAEKEHQPEKEEGKPGSSLVSQLLSQQADAGAKGSTPKEQIYSVTLSTDQLKEIVESRHRDLMKEVTSLKGSVLVMMQCLVNILSDSNERGNANRLQQPLQSAPVPSVPRFDPTRYQKRPSVDLRMYDQRAPGQGPHFGHTQHHGPGEFTLQQMIQMIGSHHLARAVQDMPPPQDGNPAGRGARSREKK